MINLTSWFKNKGKDLEKLLKESQLYGNKIGLLSPKSQATRTFPTTTYEAPKFEIPKIDWTKAPKIKKNLGREIEKRLRQSKLLKSAKSAYEYQLDRARLNPSGNRIVDELFMPARNQRGLLNVWNMASQQDFGQQFQDFFETRKDTTLLGRTFEQVKPYVTGKEKITPERIESGLTSFEQRVGTKGLFGKEEALLPKTISPLPRRAYDLLTKGGKTGLYSKESERIIEKMTKPGSGGFNGLTKEEQDFLVSGSLDIIFIATTAPRPGGGISPKLRDFIRGKGPVVEPAGQLLLPSGKPSAKKQIVNLDRLNLTKEEKTVMETVIAKVKPQFEKLKGGKLSNDEVAEAALTSDIMERVVPKAESKQVASEFLRARQEVVAVDKEVTKLLKKGDNEMAEMVIKDLIERLKVVKSGATDRGRQLQALKIQAGEVGTRQKVLSQIAAISDKTDEIARQATKVKWDDARSVTKFYRNWVEPSKLEIFDEYRYSNALSGFGTQMRNFTGNLVQLIDRPVIKAFSGDPKGAALFVRGAIQGLPKAVENAGRGLRGELVPQKLELRRLATLKLPVVFQVPFRVLEGADQLFQTMLREGELASGASLKEANKIAERWVFRNALDPANKTGQGYLLSGMDALAQKFLNLRKPLKIGGKTVSNPVSWFSLFVQTPLQIAKGGIERTPIVGLANIPGVKNKKEAFAKQLVGSLVMLLSAIMAMQDRTTGPAPRDSKARELFYAEGKKPFSVKVGNVWIPMISFGVFFPALAIPAAWRWANEESPTAMTDSNWKKAEKGMLEIMKRYATLPFLEGLGTFVDIFSGNPSATFGSGMAFNASQLIPAASLQRDIAKLIDNIYRRPKGFLESLMSGIPFLSKQISPHTTPAGLPAKRLPLNILTPFDVGIETPQTQQLGPFFDARIQQLQQNRVKSQRKKSLEETVGRLEAGREPKEGNWFSELFFKKRETTKEGIITDPLLLALEKQAKSSAETDRIKEIFSVGLPRQEIEKILMEEGFGTWAEASTVIIEKLEIKTGSRPDYIKGLLKDLPNIEYREMVLFLAEKSCLTTGVVDYWFNAGTITKQQKSQLKEMIKFAKGKKTSYTAGGTIRKKRKLPKVKSPSYRTIKVSAPPKSKRIPIMKPKRLEISKIVEPSKKKYQMNVKI